MISNALITEKKHKTSWRAIFLNNENASSSLKMGVILFILMVTLVNTPISGGHGAESIHFLQPGKASSGGTRTPARHKTCNPQSTRPVPCSEATVTSQIRPQSLDTTGLVSGIAKFPAKLRAGMWSPGKGIQYKLINEELFMFFL